MFGKRRDKYIMRSRRRGGALVLFLLLVLAACGQSPDTQSGLHPVAEATLAVPTLSPVLPPPRYQPQVSYNIPYGPLPAETLDLCQPQGATDLRPGVILIHSGGWDAGDKSEFAPECNLLASEGFVAATINYRLVPAHIWPTQLVDVQLAVRYLRAHASELMLDPDRLCSWGHSSGAHLAVFLGVLSKIHPGDEAALLSNESPAVFCTIDDFGIVNLETYGVTTSQKYLLQNLFGGATLESDPAVYHDASPLFLVSPQSARMLIVQGTQDTTVFPEQSQELQQALQAHGVPVQYLSYEGEHGFGGLSYQQQQLLENESVSFLIGYEHP
jgi:acetyl esterase/lipase